MNVLITKEYFCSEKQKVAKNISQCSYEGSLQTCKIFIKIVVL